MPTSEAIRRTSDVHLLGLGDIQRLERLLAARWGMAYGVAMPSATTALLALGLAFEVRGRTFVTTPLTYGATVGPWMMLGATPVFADVHADTLTLRPDAVWRARNQKSRLVLAADLFGMPGDDERLRAVADAIGAWYVLDASQGFGAQHHGRPTGASADAVVLSFTTGKTVDAGEGGAVLTSSREIYERLVWHSQHPYRQKRELGLHRVNEFGVNGRLHPDVAARILRELEDVDARLAKRRREVASLLGQLAYCPHVGVPALEPGVAPAWLKVTVRAKWHAPDVVPWLSAHGWAASARPFPLQPLYEHAAWPIAMRAPRCAVAEREARQRIWLQEGDGVSFSRRVLGVERKAVAV